MVQGGKLLDEAMGPPGHREPGALRRQRPAKAGQIELDGPHLVLLVLTIAVLVAMVVTGFK